MFVVATNCLNLKQNLILEQAGQASGHQSAPIRLILDEILVMECEGSKYNAVDVDLTLGMYLVMALILQERGIASILFHWSSTRMTGKYERSTRVHETRVSNNNKGML